MHDAVGHLAILAGGVLAAYAFSLAMAPGKPTERADPAEVVALPQRPSAPETNSTAPQPPAPAAAPQRNDRDALARQIQTELKRVGCYDGEVHGVWTTAVRRAMRDFTQRVNARLPVDKPDAVLLALVQGEKGELCRARCDDGRCRHETTAGRAEDRVEPAEAVPAKPLPSPPAIVAVPPLAAAAPSPPAAVPTPIPPVEAAAPEPPERTVRSREARMARAARRHQRRLARRSTYQVRYARSVFRTLRRAASLGLPF
jgi:hypothetical protein